MSAEPLPVQQVAALEASPETPRWLVRDLWAHQAVGVLAGAPKSFKSWLGLDLSISIASGTPCLGRFEVAAPGPALVYLAEDSPAQVRQRIAGICAHRRLDLPALPLHVITVPTLMLDQVEHQQALTATVEQLAPRWLLLDPLIRCHSGDENSSADISKLLGFLRRLQRSYGTAVALVHHMTKRPHAQLGQALRGSSDIFAWFDSGAYLVRRRDKLTLTAEHRAAPSPEPIDLALVHEEAEGADAHLEVVDDEEQPTVDTPLSEGIRRVLMEADKPLSRTTLRSALRVNNKRLGDALHRLEQRQLIVRSREGWSLPSSARGATGASQAPSAAEPSQMTSSQADDTTTEQAQLSFL